MVSLKIVMLSESEQVFVSVEVPSAVLSARQVYLESPDLCGNGPLVFRRARGKASGEQTEGALRCRMGRRNAVGQVYLASNLGRDSLVWPSARAQRAVHGKSWNATKNARGFGGVAAGNAVQPTPPRAHHDIGRGIGVCQSVVA